MDEFIARWHFVRSETVEILRSLNDRQLQFKPEGEKWQPLYYQFGCIARTQLVYAAAARSGMMDFSLFGSGRLPDKDAYQTAAEIAAFLEDGNKDWLDAVRVNQAGVTWPDGKKSIMLHIANLAEHERLHHGQLISYFTLAGIELPSGFKRNWAL